MLARQEQHDTKDKETLPSLDDIFGNPGPKSLLQVIISQNRFLSFVLFFLAMIV